MKNNVPAVIVSMQRYEEIRKMYYRLKYTLVFIVPFPMLHFESKCDTI